MKKLLPSLMLLLSMIALYGCPRLECEQNLVIENKSNRKVLIAEKSIGFKGDVDGKCKLHKIIELDASGAYSYYIARCIQGGGGLWPREIYIIDPSKFNDESNNRHYGCDSIGYYNDVLKEYKFETPDDFRKVNYKVVYE